MTEKPLSSPPRKTILITGGTSGLGAASALALARLHPSSRIYLAGRNASAAASHIAQIATSEKEPTAELIFLPLDLTSLPSIRSAALHLLSLEPHLDVLLANAGIAAVPPGTRTAAGHEAHLGTNHVGHALLIRLLLPLLEAAPGGGGRVVSVTSFAFRFARWGVPLSEDGGGGGDWLVDWMMVWRWLRYAESKLANVVYARELARRFPGVVSVSVCPGFVETEMVKGMGFCDRVGTRVMGWLEGGMVSPEVGARNQIWAATVGRGELKNGGVYEPVGKEMGDLGGPVVDVELGERLWEWTEREIAPWL